MSNLYYSAVAPGAAGCVFLHSISNKLFSTNLQIVFVLLRFHVANTASLSEVLVVTLRCVNILASDRRACERLVDNAVVDK